MTVPKNIGKERELDTQVYLFIAVPNEPIVMHYSTPYERNFDLPTENPPFIIN